MKKGLYAKYRTLHADALYGAPTLHSIRSRFPVWDAYYGKYLPRRNARILDLGCGHGALLLWLRERGFERIDGVDISEEEVHQAHRFGIGEARRADFRDVLKKSAGRYDAIFALDVLEHFTKGELSTITNLIYLALKVDGVLIIQTVNAVNPLWGRLRHGDLTHETAFTQESIEQLLKASNFRDVRVYPQRPVVHGVKSLIRYVFWRLLEAFFSFYLLIETGRGSGVFTQNIIVVTRR